MSFHGALLLPTLMLVNTQIVLDHTYQAKTVAFSNGIWPVAQYSDQQL